jgi:hypothetical protein
MLCETLYKLPIFSTSYCVLQFILLRLILQWAFLFILSFLTLHTVHWSFYFCTCLSLFCFISYLNILELWGTAGILSMKRHGLIVTLVYMSGNGRLWHETGALFNPLAEGSPARPYSYHVPLSLACVNNWLTDWLTHSLTHSRTHSMEQSPSWEAN